MTKNELKDLGSARYISSMFLPKYKRIVEDLYQKAIELDNSTKLEILIPTIEDLNESKTIIRKR